MADLAKVVHFTNVRLSYPNLITPQVNKDPKGGPDRVSYGASLILEPGDPNFAKFMQVVTETAMTKWKEQGQLVLNHINGDKSKRCYAKGEEKVNTTTMLPNPENVGKILIASYNRAMPQMVDAQGNPVDPANTMACQAIARKMYPGCRVNVALKPWPQDNAQGKAIRCELVALQFCGDDTPFGEGHVDVKGMFGATDEGATAGAPGTATWAPGGFGTTVSPAGVTYAVQPAPPSFGAPTAPVVPAWGAPATKPPSFM